MKKYYLIARTFDTADIIQAFETREQALEEGRHLFNDDKKILSIEVAEIQIRDLTKAGREAKEDVEYWDKKTGGAGEWLKREGLI